VLLLNVFVLLPGRTGYIVAIVAISLSLFWATSKKWQIPVIIFTPLILISSIYWGNNHAHQKLYSMLVESKDYVQHAQTESSSGWRLNAWHRSLQAISDKPLLGYGVGSWSPAVKRFEGPSATRAFGTNNSSNPHQEFLLWGVELGGVGIVLILSFLAGVALDAKHFPTGPRRAVLCILAITATASLFNSVLFDDLIGDYLVVVLGITISYGIRKTAEMEKIG
jgi:O-antigen ligase